jgi:hypothetical protein
MIEGQMQLRYDAQMSQILDGIHVVSKKNKVRRRRDPERRQAGYVPAFMLEDRAHDTGMQAAHDSKIVAREKREAAAAERAARMKEDQERFEAARQRFLDEQHANRLKVSRRRQVCRPILDPFPGPVNPSCITVTITTETPSDCLVPVKIYYTMNGQTPSLALIGQSPNMFEYQLGVPITILKKGVTVLQAIAVKDGFLPSEVGVGRYDVAEAMTCEKYSCFTEFAEDPAWKQPRLKKWQDLGALKYDVKTGARLDLKGVIFRGYA